MQDFTLKGMVVCVNAGSYGYQVINGYGLRIFKDLANHHLFVYMFGIKY